MSDNAKAAARAENVPVGCRFPEDRVDLLDAISKRRGDADRATTIRFALNRLIAEHFPGESSEAA